MSLLRFNYCQLYPIDGKPLLAACVSSEVACAEDRRRHPHTVNGEHSWFFIGKLSFSIQERAKDVAQSASQEAQYYHAGVIYLLT